MLVGKCKCVGTKGEQKWYSICIRVIIYPMRVVRVQWWDARSSNLKHGMYAGNMPASNQHPCSGCMDWLLGMCHRTRYCQRGHCPLLQLCWGRTACSCYVAGGCCYQHWHWFFFNYQFSFVLCHGRGKGMCRRGRHAFMSVTSFGMGGCFAGWWNVTGLLF